MLTCLYDYMPTWLQTSLLESHVLVTWLYDCTHTHTRWILHVGPQSWLQSRQSSATTIWMALPVLHHMITRLQCTSLHLHTVDIPCAALELAPESPIFGLNHLGGPTWVTSYDYVGICLHSSFSASVSLFSATKSIELWQKCKYKDFANVFVPRLGGKQEVTFSTSM